MATKKVTIAVALRPDGKCAAHFDDTIYSGADADREARASAVRDAMFGNKAGPPTLYLVEVELEIPTHPIRTATVVRRIDPVYPVEAETAAVQS